MRQIFYDDSQQPSILCLELGEADTSLGWAFPTWNTHHSQNLYIPCGVSLATLGTQTLRYIRAVKLPEKKIEFENCVSAETLQKF